jgi:ribosomal protein L34E
VKRSVWRIVKKDEVIYVPRCSSCGKFRKGLRAHWFFTGLYCIECIQDRLYDNARIMREMT